MSNHISAISLMLAIALTGCQPTGPQTQSRSDEVSDKAARPPQASADPVELTDAQLCHLLSAEEVTAALGSQRTAGPHSFGGCLYENPNLPALRMFNSSHPTRAEHMELIKGLNGSCKDGPDDSLLCSIGFDAKNGEISAVWFTQDGAALEIESDAGMSDPEALALLASARN